MPSTTQIQIEYSIYHIQYIPDYLQTQLNTISSQMIHTRKFNLDSPSLALFSHFHLHLHFKCLNLKLKLMECQYCNLLIDCGRPL